MSKNKILGILLLCTNCFNPPPIEGTSSEIENSSSSSDLIPTETDPWNGTFGTTFITSLTSTNIDVTTENNLTISDLPENTMESTGLSESTEQLIETSTGEEMNSSTSIGEPICGDGMLNNDEQCDDGNRFDEDDCSSECFKSRIVFLTDEFIGLNNFGGIDIADQFCKDEAIQFGLNGTFKAWISDDNPNNDPYVRFNSLDFAGWYKSLPVDGDVFLIAKGWNGLAAPLLNSINITSSGTKDLITSRVWTATKPNGKRVTNVSTCSNWQSLADNQTIVGNPQVITDHWTDGSGAQCSGMSGPGKLYCFQID